MNMTVDIDLSGLVSKLSTVKNMSFKVPLKASAGQLVTNIITRMRKDKAPNGTKWNNYKESTLHPTWKLKDGSTRSNIKKWNSRTNARGVKMRYSKSSKLLNASGANGLVGSIDTLKGSDKKNSIEVGINRKEQRKYAFYQNKLREFLGSNNKDKKSIKIIFEQFIDKTIKKFKRLKKL